MHPPPPSYLDRFEFVATAHDGSGMEHPTRCMRYRFSCQERCSLPVQPRLHAKHWKADMAHYQRWQVRDVTRPPPRSDFFFCCSKKYVDTILSELPAEQLHLSTPVHAVSSGEGKSILVTATGKRETFDHIIFACHADDVLRILNAGSGATPEEREILGAFRWNRNDVWLHSDEKVGVHSSPPFTRKKWLLTRRTCQLMPRSRLAWSCWNSIMRTTFDENGAVKANDPQVSL